MLSRSLPPVFVLLILAFANGCSSGGGTLARGLQGVLPAASSPTGSTGGKIQHVIIVVQENRSFESFFAGYPGANAPMVGWGKNSQNQRIKIPLKKITFGQSANLLHSWSAAMRMWDNGQMDGFSAFGQPGAHQAYSYVNQTQLAPYWTMAKQYVLADEMFPTEFGPSYTAHMTLIAGTDNLSRTQALVDFPSHPPMDCDAPPGTTSTFVDQYRIVYWRLGPFPCYTQFKTMADTLDAAGLSWKYYETSILNAGIWAPFEAIANVRYGPYYFKDISAPPFNVLKDIQNGNLANVSWVTPTKEDSDHPGLGTDRGPSWSGAIVNAVGQSKYWDSTAIVIVWDEWGGQYDNVPPPQLDFRGLGIRVPCLIISPYAKQNYVSHTIYEWGSILKFVEQVFGLPALGSAQDGYTDARANSLIDSFNFNQSPRRFKTIPTKYKIQDFTSEPPSVMRVPVDDE